MRDNPYKSPEAEGTVQSRTAGPIAQFVRLVLLAFTITIYAVLFLALVLGGWPIEGELQFVFSAVALVLAIAGGFRLLRAD